MESLSDWAILHVFLSLFCFICLWIIYQSNPKSRADRADTLEYSLDKIVYILSIVVPYFTLPIIIMHFNKELIDFLSGNKNKSNKDK